MGAPQQARSSTSPSSWWAFLSLIPFLNWLPFLYIGLTSGNSAWNVWALVYALPSALWILVPDLTDALVFPWFGLWFVSIYHAFRVRGEYNRRMDAKRGLIALSATVPQWQPAAQPIAPATSQAVDVEDVIPSLPPTPVDVNNASAESIAAIPGVGSVLAQKAVAERLKRGGFRSLEDFGEAVGLMPHVLERIRPIVVIAPPAVQANPEASTGRVVDV